MIDQTDPRIGELQLRIAVRDRLQAQLTQAHDALSQGVYRLDTIELSIALAEEEIHKLESLSLAGVLSSLLGNKAGKIDARRRESEDLQREYKQCEQAVQSLTRQVETLMTELAGYADVDDALAAISPNDADDSTALSRNARRQLERAHEAAESLVNQLGGMFKLCNRLRSGPNPFGRSGALIAAGVQAYRSSVANGVTSQIAESVQRLCDQLRQLELDPEDATDAELLATLNQIERFAEPSGSALSGGSDAWAELEVLARGFVSDLDDRLAHG